MLTFEHMYCNLKNKERKPHTLSVCNRQKQRNSFRCFLKHLLRYYTDIQIDCLYFLQPTAVIYEWLHLRDNRERTAPLLKRQIDMNQACSRAVIAKISRVPLVLRTNDSQAETKVEHEEAKRLNP